MIIPLPTKDMKLKLLQQKVVAGHMHFTGFCPNQAKGVDMDNIPVPSQGFMFNCVSSGVDLHQPKKGFNIALKFAPFFWVLPKKNPSKILGIPDMHQRCFATCITTMYIGTMGQQQAHQWTWHFTSILGISHPSLEDTNPKTFPLI